LIQGNNDKTPLFSDLNIGFGMISTFPAIMFAMNGFQYVPSLQHDMKDPKKLSFCMNVGICIVLAIYIALSISLMICSDGSIKDLQN
jgi:amino acid permease